MSGRGCYRVKQDNLVKLREYVRQTSPQASPANNEKNTEATVERSTK